MAPSSRIPLLLTVGAVLSVEAFVQHPSSTSRIRSLTYKPSSTKSSLFIDETSAAVGEIQNTLPNIPPTLKTTTEEQDDAKVPHETPSSSKRRTAPSSSRLIQQRKIVRTVDSIEEFNSVVLDNKGDDETTIVVRFVSPFCNSCKAISMAYDRVTKLYHKNGAASAEEEVAATTADDKNKNNVLFVDAVITEKNDIRDSLSIMGVPYAHVYKSGHLVKEMPLARKYFRKFKEELSSLLLFNNNDSENNILAPSV